MRRNVDDDDDADDDDDIQNDVSEIEEGEARNDYTIERQKK